MQARISFGQFTCAGPVEEYSRLVELMVEYHALLQFSHKEQDRLITHTAMEVAVLVQYYFNVLGGLRNYYQAVLQQVLI